MHAQFRAGLLGGLNTPEFESANSVTPKFNNNHSIVFGVIIDYKLNENFSLQAQPVYTATESDFNITTFGNPKFLIRYSNLEIPFGFRYSIGGKFRPYITAGPVISINLGSEMGASLAGFQIMMDTKSITRDVNFGLTIGTGISYQLDEFTLMAEVRYTKMSEPLYEPGEIKFSTINSFYSGHITDLPNLKLRSFNFTIGFMLPVQ